jgi:L-rhamnose isomerase / sugar isomerase
MTEKLEALIHRALDNFNVELPSWNFANTGTRFGKYTWSGSRLNPRSATRFQ